MELGRNVTLGRYVDRESFVHGMDARLKILAWLIYAGALFFASSYASYIFLTGVLLFVAIKGDIAGGYFIRGLRPMVPFLVFMYIFQILFSTSLYPESEQILWDWAIFTISAEGIFNSTLVIYRVVLLFLSVTLLTLTTRLVALVDAMERLTQPLRRVGIPTQELALAIAISLRFLPTLIEEAEKLIKAQASRGVAMDVGGPIRRLRARLPVLVPLIINTLNRTNDLTDAMHARCYRGGGGRTKRRTVNTTTSDWRALTLIFVALIVAFGLKSVSTLP